MGLSLIQPAHERGSIHGHGAKANLNYCSKGFHEKHCSTLDSIGSESSNRKMGGRGI